MYDDRTGLARGGSFAFRTVNSFAKAIGASGIVGIAFNGQQLWLDTFDSRTLTAFGELRGHHPVWRTLDRLLQPGDTFVDVGANHGCNAVLAAHRVGPSGAVVAVEPQAHLCEVIGRSLASSPAGSHSVHAVALGDRTATGQLFVPRSNSGAANLYERAGDRSGVTTIVRVARADDELRWQDFPGKVIIKLDVEGSELAFLRGAEQLVRHHRPVILFELSDTNARRAGSTAADLLEELRQRGYMRLERFTNDSLVEVEAETLDLSIQQDLVARV